MPVDHHRFVEVRVAREEPTGRDRRAQQHIDVFEQPTERIPQRCLFDQTFVERHLGVHGCDEGSRVVIQRIAVLGFDFGDARPEDPIEVRSGGLPEAIDRPGQHHVFDLCAGQPQRLADRVGVGDDIDVDWPIAEGDTQTNAHTIDARRVARDLRWVAQRDDVSPMRPGDHVLEQPAIGDSSREWSIVAVLVEVIRSEARNPAEWWLESNDSAERCRDADGTADVATRGERCIPGGERCGGSTRRSARCELGVPRIAGDAPQLAVGEPGTAELRRGRADVDDPAGILDAFDDRVVVLGDLIDQRQRTLLPRPPNHWVFFLGGDAEALERSRRISLAEVSLLR